MTTILTVSFAVIFACAALWAVTSHLEDKHREREKDSN
jgi:hypothetical protein